MYPEIARAMAAGRAADLMHAAEAHRQIRAARQARRADHRLARKIPAQRPVAPAEPALRQAAPARRGSAAPVGSGGRASDDCVGAGSAGDRRRCRA